MVKVNVGALQVQMGSVMAYCASLKEAASGLTEATAGVGLELGIDGVAADAIKGYLSTAYPALAKAMITYAEDFESAHQDYVAGYNDMCHGESLDSEKLQEQINRFNQLIKAMETERSTVEQKKNASIGEVVLFKDYYAGISRQLASEMENMQGQKAELEEKLQALLDFDAKSSRYFENASKSREILNEGLTAVGRNPDGSIGQGRWNGSGFTPLSGKWLKQATEKWDERHSRAWIEVDGKFVENDGTYEYCINSSGYGGYWQKIPEPTEKPKTFVEREIEDCRRLLANGCFDDGRKLTKEDQKRLNRMITGFEITQFSYYMSTSYAIVYTGNYYDNLTTNTPKAIPKANNPSGSTWAKTIPKSQLPTGTTKVTVVQKTSGANVNKIPRNLIDNMDEISDDIRNINKKYSSGFEQNNSIDNIINSASYYEDAWEQTSAVTRSIADHAFENGNKRTAFDTLNMLLDDLGLKSPLNDTQKWALIDKLGRKEITNVSEIANILKGK